MFRLSRRKFSSYRISISFTNGTRNSWIGNQQLQRDSSCINLRQSRLTCYKCRRRTITTDKRTTTTVAGEAVEIRKRVLHSCFSPIFWGKRKFWDSKKLERWTRERGVSRQVRNLGWTTLSNPCLIDRLVEWRPLKDLDNVCGATSSKLRRFMLEYIF